ncbi:MAG: hypothetical protein LKE52_04525 [Bacilli bacterium]|nr:hypothetical protein [Bacilli bacterium]
MTLSWMLLLIAPLLLLPAILLPENRIRTFLFSLIVPFLVALSFALVGRFYPPFVETLGSFAKPLSQWALRGHPELSSYELDFLSYTLFSALITIVLFFLFLLPAAFFFVGKNPEIHKPTRTIRHILKSILFFVLTYGLVSYFLIAIRLILPIPDGFLSFLFEWIHPIGA